MQKAEADFCDRLYEDSQGVKKRSEGEHKAANSGSYPNIDFATDPPSGSYCCRDLVTPFNPM
jgi:hypothetical protein